jgi:hypothetical protein
VVDVVKPKTFSVLVGAQVDQALNVALTQAACMSGTQSDVRRSGGLIF